MVAESVATAVDTIDTEVVFADVCLGVSKRRKALASRMWALQTPGPRAILARFKPVPCRVSQEPGCSSWPHRCVCTTPAARAADVVWLQNMK